MASELKIAPVGASNTGNGKLGYVACIHSEAAIAAVSVPAGYADQYCEAEGNIRELESMNIAKMFLV
jgi:hypothetical protein